MFEAGPSRRALAQPDREGTTPAAPAPVELIRALATFLEAPREEHRRLAGLLELPPPPSAIEHTEVLTFQVHPYASVYLGLDGMVGGEIRDRVDGFFRAVGRTVPPESDHIGNLLSLFAALSTEAMKGEVATARLADHAQRALVAEYMAPWIHVFLDAVVESSEGPFFPAWARLLEEALGPVIGGCQDGALAANESSAPSESAGGRSLGGPLDEGVPDPRKSGGEAFILGILAPARSGIVVTRRGIARAAGQATLAPRPGGRRFMLESLFDQDPDAVLAWMEAEGRAWTDRHRRRLSTPSTRAGDWLARSRALIGLVGELRTELARDPATP